jgi:hypothetical protein
MMSSDTPPDAKRDSHIPRATLSAGRLHGSLLASRQLGLGFRRAEEEFLSALLSFQSQDGG